MKNVIPAVGVLVFKDDTILLVEHLEGAGHLNGTYGLPSGRLEKDEKHIVAAIRELEEETGITTTETDLIEYSENIYTATLKRKRGITVESSIKVFICMKFSGEIRGSIETSPRWIKISAIEKYRNVLLPNIEKMIKDGLEFLEEQV
ncbi:MAG: NUDIX domain-containing protein [Candidatus Levybacteria bacterium]|nr:NUDIX domain-containing protein [Candidatus Levybacteria bacterium]